MDLVSLIIGVVIGAVFSPILIKLARLGYNYINTKVNKLGK